MRIIWLISISLLISACQKKVYNSVVCEDLSIRAFKGWPKALNEYKKNCQGIEITFTKQRCQEVLNNFVLIGDIDLIKSKYGERASECLTLSDLKKFTRSRVKTDDNDHSGSKSNSDN